MRRIVIALSSTITALVLLLSWPTSLNRGTSSVPLANTAALGSAGTAATTPAAAAAAPAAAPAAAGAAPAPKGKDGSYTGSSVSTRYGNVQVKITVAGGKITAADAVAYPNQDGHSAQISSYAVPVLSQSAVSAQSSKISMIGGATYTSTGYIKSLQSAIDKAGL